jgi:hypothetical protein
VGQRRVFGKERNGKEFGKKKKTAERADKAQDDMQLENASAMNEQPKWEIALSAEFLALTAKDLNLSEDETKTKDVSKKVRQTGRNWFVVIRDPNESFDFLGALNNNSSRFKFGIWQHVAFKETLFIQGYIEGNASMTIGTLQKIFSKEGQYEIRKCRRCVRKDVRINKMSNDLMSKMGEQDSDELMSKMGEQGVVS